MKKLVNFITTTLVLIIISLVIGTVLYGTKTINDLLSGNEKMLLAIDSLTREDQIGFAKVTKQEVRDGQLYTTVKFVETARDDMLTRVLEKEYEIEGDVIHFDALIVTFFNDAVIDGKSRSLYLWRRVYGEDMRPSDGYEIESYGEEPERYAGLMRQLRIQDQKVFWEAIWNLSNDPEALVDHGVRAIYGNVVYKKLQPGLIYVFKISANGRVFPETVLDM